MNFLYLSEQDVVYYIIHEYMQKFSIKAFYSYARKCERKANNSHYVIRQLHAVLPLVVGSGQLAPIDLSINEIAETKYKHSIYI